MIEYLSHKLDILTVMVHASFNFFFYIPSLFSRSRTIQWKGMILLFFHHPIRTEDVLFWWPCLIAHELQSPSVEGKLPEIQ